jgi:hypothetical protein
MKTPMQELIEKLKEERSKLQALNERVMVLTLDYAIADAEQMLEKEKDVMCEFAFNCGDEIKDQNNWRSPRNLTNYEVILDYYNKTFNTKEK